MMKLLNFSNRAIEYLFYSLFFLVPIVFLSNTSELFEFNKMWVTYGIAILIGFFWILKIVITKQIRIRRTPLDIPILLFLLAHLISTVISWDPYVSFWGYYSRFNGGTLSILTYAFLYFAFASNVIGVEEKKDLSNFPKFLIFLAASFISSFVLTVLVTGGTPTSILMFLLTSSILLSVVAGIMIFGLLPGNPVRKLLGISLLSGLFVALWGLPSHFGYDPTCFVFRGELNVSCWTADFQPKLRIFSTLGQPAWLAAYLSILLPVSIAYAISKKNGFISTLERFGIKRPETISFTAFTLLSALFFLNILYTQARAGIAATLLTLFFFAVAIFVMNRTPIKKVIKSYRNLILILLILAGVGFMAQVSLPVLDKLSLANLKQYASKNQKAEKPKEALPEEPHAIALGGTDSGKIRLIVWKGAMDVWRANPLFGTGVETFAYSYYKYRPAAHNLTSEWNFLYNKAHNEYLNYLATTGAFGLFTYLLFILVFTARTKKAAFDAIKSKIPFPFASRFPQTSAQTAAALKDPINLSLVLGFFSILITNFFGFSVVIINIYFFLIPLMFFALTDMLGTKWKVRSFGRQDAEFSLAQKLVSLLAGVVALFLLFLLIRFWIADKDYALGYNLSRAGQYQEAYGYLLKANSKRAEPVFQDELAVNSAILATFVLSQGPSSTQSAQTASSLIQEAIGINDKLVKDHPKNIVFWKSRVRIFYNLAQIDASFLPKALEAMKKTHELAPTEASISYNLGVLYGQNSELDNAVKTLEETIKLKPDYRDAYFALGIFYHELALNAQGNVVKPELQKKAEDSLNYILKNLNVDDEAALQTLQSWNSQ